MEQTLREQVIQHLQEDSYTHYEMVEKCFGGSHNDLVGEILRSLSRSGYCERKRSRSKDKKGRPWVYTWIDEEVV